MTNEFIPRVHNFLLSWFLVKKIFYGDEINNDKDFLGDYAPFRAVKKLLRQQSDCGVVDEKKRKGQWVGRGDRRQRNYCCILQKLSAPCWIIWNQRIRHVATEWHEPWIAPSPAQKYFLTIFFYCYHCFSRSWNFIYNISFVLLFLFLFFVYLSLKSTGKKLLINMNNSCASSFVCRRKFFCCILCWIKFIKLQSLTRGGLEACFISQLRWQSDSIDASRRTTHLCYSVNRVQK